MTVIRKATHEDAAALAELAARTFRDTFAAMNRAGDIDTHCRNHFAESIQAGEIADPDRTTLVCEDGGQLIAFGQLRTGHAPTCVIARRPLEIQRLYVDAPWHGKGTAQSLMTSMLESAAARGADVAWLGVWERNPRAISFYVKSGFKIVGEHVFLLGTDPQRDLVLAKKLS
jgi:ribosomal protein S18 acetylase RimI-like enzyme